MARPHGMSERGREITRVDFERRKRKKRVCNDIAHARVKKDEGKNIVQKGSSGFCYLFSHLWLYGLYHLSFVFHFSFCSLASGMRELEFELCLFICLFPVISSACICVCFSFVSTICFYHLFLPSDLRIKRISSLYFLLCVNTQIDSRHTTPTAPPLM